MKISKLKLIIKEEISNFFNSNTSAKYGYINESEMDITLEGLPKFSELPEEGYDGDISITLPNINIADAGVIIYSKAVARKWEKDFINKWGLIPGEEEVRFSSKSMPLKIVNASDKYNKWKAGEIETKGAAYDRLGSYKGD
jgi:hypothetical protein